MKKRKNKLLVLVNVVLGGTLLFLSSSLNPEKIDRKVLSKQKIMISLLLDTSNSMDGLINQAKSQLWTIVNQLSRIKDAKKSNLDIYIALFEYGNTSLPSSEGYIRMVTPLTNDLDQISEDLFSLKTNGGDEFCGQVIKRAVDQLEWSESSSDLKIIFIAGNEPFTQGDISYKLACKLAKEKEIVVNTIYCGDYRKGVETFWKDGASITGGVYMSIEQDRETTFIESPYDRKINELNDSLNETYLYYGKKGYSKKLRQEKQDLKALSISSSNKTKRAIFKSSSSYKNPGWDLADAYEKDKNIIRQVEEVYLPEEIKEIPIQKREEYVREKLAQRKELKKKILKLKQKRDKFISNKRSKLSDKESQKSLDSAMLKSLKRLARTKNLNFAE